MTDNVRKLFAVNLRAQCAKFPSIAHVCRGAGINRQQFNKYLSGEYLPNARTRKVLCEFLGVAEEEMFGRLQPTPAAAPSPANPTAAHSLEALLQSDALKQILERIGFRPMDDTKQVFDGYYSCYFPMPNYPDFLVRSALKISTLAGQRTFTRHTNFVSTTFPGKSIAKGRHVGIIVGNEVEFYFLGLNQSTPSHLSLLSFSRTQISGGSTLAGIGVTRSVSQAYSSRVCLEYLGNVHSAGRRSLSRIGVVALKDKSVPAIVSTLMATSGNGAAQVTPPPFELSFAMQLLADTSRSAA